MTALQAALIAVADALDALPDDVLPTPRYTIGGPGARAAIDVALVTAVRQTGLPKRDVYRAIRDAIAPAATLPIPDLVQLFGRARVIPTLRDRFT